MIAPRVLSKVCGGGQCNGKTKDSEKRASSESFVGILLSGCAGNCATLPPCQPLQDDRFRMCREAQGVREGVGCRVTTFFFLQGSSSRPTGAASSPWKPHYQSLSR